MFATDNAFTPEVVASDTSKNMKIVDNRHSLYMSKRFLRKPV